MIRQDIAVGSIIVLLGATVVFKERVFLEKTKKGQRLVAWFGADRARWVLRGITMAVMFFGALLTGGVIKPVQWQPF